MQQFLPRGCELKKDNRIMKVVSSGENWQIYLSNNFLYVLAVTDELYEKWISDYSLPEGIFLKEKINGCNVLISSKDYIISSLDKGPFPDNYGQVEAFSISFKTTLGLFENIKMQDAIYIEEYSLILPVEENTTSLDNDIIYGKWLTGGINLSVYSTNRLCQILSWLPSTSVVELAKVAGFDVELPEPELPVKEEAEDVVTVYDGQDTQVNCDGSFSLIGRPDLEKFFNEHIVDIVLNQAKYERMGIPFPGATILYGAPGCGKTYAVEKLSEYLGWKRFDIDSSTIASSYIHDTSKKISEVFSAAIKAAPSILVIDEMEAFLSDRGMAGPSGMHHVEEVAEFLRRIPEAISKGVLVFAMTNMIDTIDPAVLRRGRFDHQIEVKMPTAEEIEALLASKFNSLPVDESVDIKIISGKLAGHPMSDVSFVVREAGRFAVKNNLDYMNMRCFEDAIELLPKEKEKPRIGF